MTAWLRGRRVVLAAAVVSRVLVLTTAAIVHLVGRPKAAIQPQHIGSTHKLLTILGFWDGRWYKTVAEHGYILLPARQSDPAFFPLFPIVLRAAHALGPSYLTAALVLANLFFVAGLLVFHELSREVVGDELARNSAVLAAFFPASYAFSMTYPESLVLLALSLALLFAFRGRWTLCAFAGAAAALTRPEALVFVLPLVAIAFARSDRRAHGPALGAVLAPAASLAAFPLYLGWALHDVFAWSNAEAAWGRSFHADAPVRAVQELFRPGRDPWLWRDVAFVLLYLGLLVVARRHGVGRAWIAAGALIVVLPLLSGTFMSEARFGLLAFPVYWGLAFVARRPAVLAALLVGSAALLVAGTMTIPLANP